MASLSPNVAGLRSLTPLAFTTARSVFGSVPMIFASAVLPSAKTTRTASPAAEATTWLLVSTYPSALSTTPEPSPLSVVIETTLSCTDAAIFGRSAPLITGAAE